MSKRRLPAKSSPPIVLSLDEWKLILSCLCVVESGALVCGNHSLQDAIHALGDKVQVHFDGALREQTKGKP